MTTNETNAKSFSVRTALALWGALCLLVFSSCAADNGPALRQASVSENTKFKSATVEITAEEFGKLGFALGDSCDVVFSNGYTLTDVPYFNGYYVKNAAPVIVAYPSDKYLTVTLNNIGIWDTAGLTDDCTVTVTLNTAGKYLATQEALGQSYSLLRDEYASDEEFCNFRALSGGRLKNNFIFRGASPVDNSRNRAKYTDGLLEKNKIASVVDLADSDDEIRAAFDEENFSSAYFSSLYESGRAVALDMSSAYASDAYKKSVAAAFRHMLNTDGPYYIHCMEGKDRTGFVCALLEALAGADYDEMCADYMKTYENYYKISAEKTPEKYNAVVSLYFDAFMECLVGTDDINVLKSADYVGGARSYLKSGGMTDGEIDAFIALVSE